MVHRRVNRPAAMRIRCSGLRLGAAALLAALFAPVAGTVASPVVPGVGARLIASPEPGWPQFRGPRRDGVSDERRLRQSWPEGGPKLLWSTTGAGRGFSSVIIGGGRCYLTGDFGEEAAVIAYDLQGKQLWRVRNGDAWLNQYQGARASATYRDGRLYHQNGHGRLACFDAATGRELWSVMLLERFGGENIRWGLSECVVVDEHAVYATAGGREALAVAFDRVTGAVRWRSEPLIDPEKQTVDNPGYAPPILVQFAGRRLLIGTSQRQLYCLDAETGKLQWTRHRPTPYGVLAMTPVLVGDAVFMTAPLGQPGTLHRLLAPASPDAPVGVEDVWNTRLDTAQGGAVHVDGRIYGSYYPKRGGWAAVDAATGEVRYEHMEMLKGSAVHADNRLYALLEDGWMLLLRDAGDRFEEHGRFRLPGTRDRDRDVWAHPTILDGRLYLRYHDTVYCYDIRAAES